MPKRVGVILSGGQSRRFGRPKAFAEHLGIPLYEHVKQALQPFVEQVLIISQPELTERFKQDPDVFVLEDVDPYKGKGPLAGIYTAMTTVIADDYLVFPCDVPLVNEGYIQWLLKKAERHSEANGIVPVAENRLHPLMGLYRKNVYPFLNELLDKNQLRVKDLVDAAHVLSVKVDEEVDHRAFFNINTKDQLKALNQ